MRKISAPGRSGIDDARELIVLALNSGASWLKFGLHRVGQMNVEMLSGLRGPTRTRPRPSCASSPRLP